MKGMKLRKLLCVILAAVLILGNVMIPGNTAAAAEAPAYRNVMYYGDWSIYAGQKNFYPSKIDGSQITHLNFAFMDVDKSGNLVLCDEHADFQAILPEQNGLTYGEPYAGVLGAMVILRAKYPNMKIGISVGGWTRSGDFPAMAANSTSRKNFAQNIAKFVDYLGFDFVDIDWEYPCDVRASDPEGNGVTIDKGCAGTPEDGHNFTLLMQDIRAELDKLDAKNGKHYELSAAMSASPAKMAVIEYDKVLDTVDFLNMMTYDLNGAWNGYTAHQTALYTNEAYDPETQPEGVFSVDNCIRYLEDNYGSAIDYSKIVVGVTSYTRGWAGVQNNGKDASCPGLYATAEPNSVKAPDGVMSGTFAYSDLNTLISQYQLKEYWDDTAKAAYFYNADTGYFFTCDTPRSIAAKGEYVKSKGLGGLICWMASQDANGEITKAMKQALYGSASLPANEIITAAPDVSVSIQATDSSTYTLTIKNNEKATESNAALKNAELFQKTVMMPKLYIETKSGTSFSAGSEAGSVTNQNGKGVVDLSGVYAAKALKPGGSHTFTLRVSKADISDIVSITMTQRILSSMDEFGAQVVYGDSGSEPTVPTVPETTKPEATDPKVTEPETTEPKVTEPETTEPKVTEPEATEPEATEPEATQPSGTSYPAWKTYTAYTLGDLVSYQGKVYECTYAHTSHEGWLPDGTPTLWKERTDLVDVPSTTDPTEPEATEPGGTDDPIQEIGSTAVPQHMVTGYWHNFCNGSTNLKLSDVPSYYDMICVAFTGNTTTPGEVTFEIDKDLAAAVGGYTKAEFIQDIKDLKAKGQHVIISVGGAEGRIDIASQAAAETFATTLIGIIEEYGFEGVDIDLEGSAVAGVDYIASALRTVHDHFGDGFIITMAPETYYVQADRLSANDITTSYLRLALEIKDILTICYPQFYNSGSMNGYGGSIVSPGNADFITSLYTLLAENGLRPDQLAIGVPATSQAAGSGYVSNSVLTTAVNALVNGTSSGGFTAPRAYPTLRGVMTWSINWDATNGYAWAKAMSDLMDTLPTVEVEPTEPEVTEPETTEPEVTEPEVTEPETTEPKVTEPEVTEPETTEPEVTEPEVTEPEATEPADTSKDTYSASKAYTGGETVVYKGNTYKAKWWTQGEDPETALVWELIASSGTSGGESSGTTTGAAAWDASKVYVGGDTVSYNGGEYKAQWWTCGDKPGTNAVWVQISGTTTEPEVTEPEVTEPEVTEPEVTEPEVTEPEVTEPEVTEPEVTEPEVTEPEVTEPQVTEPVSSALPAHMVTGYWHNFCNGSTNLKLSDVPDCYDMICVAFTGNSSVAGEATFELDGDLCAALGGYTKAEFIQDIKNLQAKGRRVIISVGGAEGRISITSDAAANTFAQSMIGIIEEYGFDGIDIDLEGGAVAGTGYIAGALRTLHNHFGDDFIITLAPETAYVQNAQGSYLKLALEIKDILTICYPQFYNSGTMIGYDGMAVSLGTADFITSQLTTIVEAGLRPDQVGIGLPSVPSAAGSGYISNDVIERAVTAFVTGTKADKFIAPSAYPGLRSMMTWSINWDATNGYAWGKAMSDLMDRVDTMEAPEQTPEESSGETTWDATKVYVGGDTVLYNGKTYQAKWWTQGNCPADMGAGSPWERIA